MSIADELAKLRRLRDDGTLTEDEFTAAKARMLQGVVEPNSPQRGRIRRSRNDRWIGGVCGGLAQSMGVESWIVRLLMTVLLLCFGAGIVAYLLCWIFVPVESVSGKT